jgi:lysophospholipase L1-like esterase
VILKQGNARILVQGDSTEFGYLSIPAGDMVGSSWPVQFCATLTASYGLACSSDTWFGAGADASHNFLTEDARFRTAGAFSFDQTVPSIGYGAFWSTATGDLCFAPTGRDDTMRVFYTVGPGLGVLHVTVDGAAIGTLSEGASTYAPAERTYTGALGQHTWCLGLDSGSKVIVNGQEGYNSSSPGVIVDLAGANAANSIQLSDQTYATGPGNDAIYSLIEPDLVMLENGIVNNWAQGISPSTTASNVQTVVNAIEKANADIAFVTPPPSATSIAGQPAQTALVDAERSIATTTYNSPSAQAAAPFIDVYTAWGTWEASNAKGWMADAEHPNANGYSQYASIVSASLTTSP